MNKLLDKIINHPLNQALLKFLKIDTSKSTLYFQPWEKTRSGFDEGGTALFDIFGKDIPNSCKYSLDTHNIMLNPETGEIFAFHTGRYSLFFKCDFEYFGLINSDNYRRGYTFDCISDITALGESWAFLDKFEDDESQQLQKAYERTFA